MSYTTLHNFKQLAKAYSGNDNPGVFILSDTTDDSSKAFEPTCVFVDDNGDLIVQVDKKKFKSEEYKTIEFKFGAMIECGNCMFDNVYSLDIHMEDDDYINIDVNGYDRIVMGTIVQCGSHDIIAELDAIEYNADGCINDEGKSTPIISNGKLIYK